MWSIGEGADLAAGQPILDVRELACIRGDRAIFAGLSFAVPAGGALLLTGANGAGKSSLLRVIAGRAFQQHLTARRRQQPGNDAKQA